MDMQEFEEIVKYDRTARMAAYELQLINEFYFGLSGSGKIEELYKDIIGDNGLMNFLDDIAIERLKAEGEISFPNDDYTKKERVWYMLENECRLPQKIYNYPYPFEKEQISLADLQSSAAHY